MNSRIIFINDDYLLIYLYLVPATFAVLAIEWSNPVSELSQVRDAARLFRDLALLRFVLTIQRRRSQSETHPSAVSRDPLSQASGTTFSRYVVNGSSTGRFSLTYPSVQV